MKWPAIIPPAWRDWLLADHVDTGAYIGPSQVAPPDSRQPAKPPIAPPRQPGQTPPDTRGDTGDSTDRVHAKFPAAIPYTWLAQANTQRDTMRRYNDEPLCVTWPAIAPPTASGSPPQSRTPGGDSTIKVDIHAHTEHVRGQNDDYSVYAITTTITTSTHYGNLIPVTTALKVHSRDPDREDAIGLHLDTLRQLLAAVADAIVTVDGLYL